MRPAAPVSVRITLFFKIIFISINIIIIILLFKNSAVHDWERMTTLLSVPK